MKNFDPIKPIWPEANAFPEALPSRVKVTQLHTEHLPSTHLRRCMDSIQSAPRCVFHSKQPPTTKMKNCMYRISNTADNNPARKDPFSHLGHNKLVQKTVKCIAPGTELEVARILAQIQLPSRLRYQLVCSTQNNSEDRPWPQSNSLTPGEAGGLLPPERMMTSRMRTMKKKNKCLIYIAPSKTSWTRIYFLQRSN